VDVFGENGVDVRSSHVASVAKGVYDFVEVAYSECATVEVAYIRYALTGTCRYRRVADIKRFQMYCGMR
jgi:hypothetical protein